MILEQKYKYKKPSIKKMIKKFFQRTNFHLDITVYIPVLSKVTIFVQVLFSKHSGQDTASGHDGSVDVGGLHTERE